jgi:hypothetical protein
MVEIAAGTLIAMAIVFEVVGGLGEIDDGEEGIEVCDGEVVVKAGEVVAKVGVVTVTEVPGIAVDVGWLGLGVVISPLISELCHRSSTEYALWPSLCTVQADSHMVFLKPAN